MRDYNINDIQTALLNIVKEVTGMCEKYGVKYYLVKGGLIGAIRHKGFIPWDPDVDIAIPYDHLEKFCSVLREHLKQPYELCYFDKQNDYEYLFPRVGIKGIDYRLLHLDVFIITNAPDNKVEQDKYFRTISWWEKLNTMRNSNIFRPINSYLNRIILVAAKLILFWMPKKYVRDNYLSLLGKYSGKSRTLLQVGAVDEYGKKYIMPAQWFDDFINVPFENITLRSPKEYDLYLKQMYGDYMKLPNAKEQGKIDRIWNFPNDNYLKNIVDR